METIVLVIHLFLALAIIGLVLLQRSEGGGLGSMGGGRSASLTTAQGTKNALTRATAICAGSFFVTSLILGILAGTHNRSSDILNQAYTSPEMQRAQQGLTGLDTEIGSALAGSDEDGVRDEDGQSSDDGEKPEPQNTPSAPVSE